MRLKSFLKYRWMARTVRMIPVSESVAADLRAAGVSPGAIRVVPNGIDLARATAASRPRSELLAALGLDDDRQLLLLFGWEPLRKGMDLACDMAETLTTEGCRIVLGAVGMEELRKYAETVRRRAHAPLAAPPAAAGERGRPLPGGGRLPLAQPERRASLFRLRGHGQRHSRGAQRHPLDGLRASQPRGGVLGAGRQPLARPRRRRGAAMDARGATRGCQANRDLVRNEFDVQVWARRVLEVYQEVLRDTVGSADR